ncbi:hypothetical protein MC7420_5943 [Coleofasciculus chthonoplastes PCC 7420]|uniref:Uncharacterized protein n=1 Tax=Coleofasciculus chthonoplastes PCC 7420 TaxID=118168 RepID=B4W4Y4_9CYAN|nr:hypothetical protein MC7420_5943 [Coleofasciculus chthonoplastes PCC 7420]
MTPIPFSRIRADEKDNYTTFTDKNLIILQRLVAWLLMSSRSPTRNHDHTLKPENLSSAENVTCQTLTNDK